VAGGKRKFTPEQREQILQFLAQGLSVADVARHFDVDPRRVGGLLSTARNTGTMPGAAGISNGWFAAPAATFLPASAPTQAPDEAPPPATDEWYTSAIARYGIERTHPADGYLGTLHGWLNPGDFAWHFGSGRYRISISENGHLIRTITWIVDGRYGPPQIPPAFPSPDNDGWRPLPGNWS
jgi:hypothetical protein